MVSKIKTLPQQAKEGALEKEDRETVADSPLAGLSDAAVQLIRSAKKRGYVTHDQINSVLPSEGVNSKQIEDVLAVFSGMGVNVVETEEASEEGEKQREVSDEEAESGAASWSRSSKRSRPSPRPRNRPSAATIPCACTCARWDRSSCFLARARSTSPSASRPAARP